ncbi:glycoside hydrolase family 88 protein [Halalkalibacter sp. APA_J-10(15)]|uniref:glycoside hydrolase family 88 protein n=1 Tax=Halalkalibacter sp. APA_J-10(15) TaxID=2933805 RepID=UPI001FF21852|nr:glycoside hydrolase family 88 protein [Halalkalibacter sp. APA_J-10(15)]MCK0473666.1 glycoside hydrolase family 88 protein [Halalkalibacter sp. APA_J-10(15)]
MEGMNDAWINQAWEDVVNKMNRTSDRIGASFPHASFNGTYDSPELDWWTNGFWPGLLWIIYREERNEKLKRYAIECEEKLDEALHQFVGLHHDVGFMWQPSAVMNYKLHGHERSKTRGLIAANMLAGRFNSVGNYIRSWDLEGSEGWSIIDTLMNLNILYWASNETGDPRYKQIAEKHANTALEHFVRDDGSAYHIVNFDPYTGKRKNTLGGQGYAPESSWARGCAWAVYGMALSYMHTGDERYLDSAKKSAHYFLFHTNEDFIPNWDFQAPLEEAQVLDTTAASCTACGLLEIARYVDSIEAKRYRNTAANILRSLYENYGAWDEEEEGLIKMGTANKPKDFGVNVPIIYGDYFFVEGLLRLKGRTDFCW